jgi:hypothetical protein
MRGTIAAEAILDGFEPVVVRGYGLVVGLNGTGNRDTPAPVRAHMLVEMSRRGFGKESMGFGDLKPEQVLDSLDTAVVIVEAVIPPGAVGRRAFPGGHVPGTRFDVRVYADPRTETTSLEGGRLYTTELRPGPLQHGGAQARTLGAAGGDIFINPFAEPRAVERDHVTRTTGMILNGGEVIRDMPLKLRLAQPSHVRVSVVQTAINSRFPREPAQPDPTARGESDNSVRITVPPTFRDRPHEFINLLRHTTIRLTDPDMVAASVRRLLLADPSYAAEASWRWRALGTRAVPIIRDLYEYPEELPRLAALRAGAMLDDALVLPHLIELARQDGGASADVRSEAIQLLAGMQANPRINRVLHELVSDDDVDVRLAAYEGLVKRGDPRIKRVRIDRRKFIVDVVESDKPMIYVTQFGEPRVVVFGGDLGIDRPVFAHVWSNRLMVQDLEDGDEIEVFYRPEGSYEGAVHRVEPTLASFVRFLGHTPTVERPMPGLGLSYGETVGALYQIWRQQFIKADFKAEQDRILAAIMRHEWETGVQPRPEFADADSVWDSFEPAPISDLERLSPRGGIGRPGQVVPVPRAGTASD